jgi:hypothetical protein
MLFFGLSKKGLEKLEIGYTEVKIEIGDSGIEWSKAACCGPSLNPE